MYGSEKPLSKRGRLTIVVLLWVIGIPLFIGLFVLMGWVAVVLFVAAVWATFDYLKKGDFFGAVDRMFTAESRVVDGLGSDDRRRRR